jgi:hypothetical protein
MTWPAAAVAEPFLTLGFICVCAVVVVVALYVFQPRKVSCQCPCVTPPPYRPRKGKK